MRKNRFIRKSFDLGSASFAFLAAFGVQLLFQAIILLAKLSDTATTWTIVIGNQLILFGACLFFCFYQKVDPIAITGAKKPPKWYFFPLFLLIAVACVVAFAPLSGVFSKLLNKLGYEYVPTYRIPMDNAGLFSLAFLALTLLPIIGEEFALRGVLMSGGKNRSALFAIFYTALIFALMHGNLRQLVHQFLLGAVMGYLAYITGGIYASAVIHLANNGLALLLEYGFKHGAIDPRAYWYVCGELGPTPTLVGISVGFFALAMLLVFVTVLLHREREKKKDFIPKDGPIGGRITDYLRFLADEEAPSAVKSESSERDRTYSNAMAIVLAGVLVLIVLLSLVPGV